MPVTQAHQFGRVAVVMGGDGSEREVSLAGGQAVLTALLERQVDAFAVDGIAALLAVIEQKRVDRVFNLLHGRGGEDGVLQGLLAAATIPVTGSGVLGSALSMDKGRSKRVWHSLGLPTPEFAVAGRHDDGAAIASELGYPLVVKPVSEGSSVGTAIVREPNALSEALACARKYEAQILIERYIAGDEYTVGVLAQQRLPVVRIETDRGFYDYQAKYIDDDTRYFCPAGLSQFQESAVQKLAFDAFAALGCSGWGRVDLIADEQGQMYLLEVNTTPGMTSHSLVPKAAQAAAIEFDQLVWRILETSMPPAAPAEVSS